MKRASLTRRRAWIWVALAALTTVLWAGPVSANSPDPIFGGTLFANDQALTHSWDATRVPEPWMQTGINAGAANSNKLTDATNAQYDPDGRQRQAPLPESVKVPLPVGMNCHA
ncbi:MAG: hypothetical protein HYX54_02040 [Chloroflexi bacterium]|nr:hypothetical protein [Chloroflexota bacterium]